MSYALGASLLGHLLVLFGGLIHFNWASDTPTLPAMPDLRVRLAAPLAPTPKPTPAAPKAADSKAPSDKANSPAKDSKNSLVRPAQPESPTQPTPEAPTETPPDTPAQQVQPPGTPRYPPEALARHLEGCVLAAIFVSPKGEVEEVRVLHSDHPGVFDQAVADAQRQARYIPTQQGGKPQPSRALAVAAFELGRTNGLDCVRRYAPAAALLNPLPFDADPSSALARILPPATGRKP